MLCIAGVARWYQLIQFNRCGGGIYFDGNVLADHNIEYQWKFNECQFAIEAIKNSFRKIGSTVPNN